VRSTFPVGGGRSPPAFGGDYGMKIVLIILALLVIGGVIMACRKAQTGSAPVASKYHPAQVWSFKTPSDQPDAKLTILLVESHPKIGTVVHIAVSGVHLPHDNTTVPHMPFAESAIDQSVISLVQESGPVPDFHEGYSHWQHAKGGVFTISVAEGLEFVRKGLEQRPK
jgi:hypothetical protein